MSSYPASLQARLADESPAVLLSEVADAFDEMDPQRLTPQARELHELARFCRFDTIVPWLRDERDALARVRDYARRHAEDEVADLIDQALQGTAQPTPTFTAETRGGPAQTIEVGRVEGVQFDGKDWGGTDIALGFAMEGFIEAVLRDVLGCAEALGLEAPLAVQRRAAAAAETSAIAARSSAAELFATLVGAHAPVMEAGPWDDDAQQVGQPRVDLPLRHVALPAADSAHLARLAARHGDAARELLDMLALHDGAALFTHGDDVGFVLASSDEWDGLLGEAIEWAEGVTWQDDPGEVPRHLYSAIAFGMAPGDSERWLLITEGEHAGKIMLSDTDLIEDRARYESMAHFMATLVHDSVTIIDNGGFLDYAVDGEALKPARYRAQ
jgi:hypothetical protein